MQEIASGVFFETGYEGVNVAAILTDEGLIALDVPSYPRDAQDWVSRLKRLHGRGVRYLILSDHHGDRILNTRWFGVPIIATRVTAERLGTYDRRYPAPLLESLTQRNPQLGRQLTSGPVDQVDISFGGQMTLHVGRRLITLLERPGPNTGSAWVHLPKSNILFVGDTLVAGAHPPLAELLMDQWLASLEMLKDGPDAPGLVLPGRGEPGGPEPISAMVAYLKLIASIVDQHIDAGGTRPELTDRALDIVDYYPVPDLATDWTRREIVQGLQRLFDHQLAATGVPVSEQ
jgi:glyoxylase-like metal-dependent hydrolase (beta-lactamase superfamily II)